VLFGHYAPALALEAAYPRARLWVLFVAVQLVDIAWAGLILAGVEHARVVDGTSAFDVLDLYDMPYTHSVVATLGWAAVAGGLTAAVVRTERWRMALVIAAAVASHIALDLVVHTPDISVAGGATPRLGLGLWRAPWLALAVEAALLVTGVALAWRSRWAAPRRRALAMLGGALLAATMVSGLVPAPPTMPGVVASMIAMFATSTIAAALVDRAGRAGRAGRD
jgi:hypothetical protein